MRKSNKNIKYLEQSLEDARSEAERYKELYRHYEALLEDVTRAQKSGLCRGTWCAVCEHSYQYPDNSDLRGLRVCRFSPCKEFKDMLLEE